MQIRTQKIFPKNWRPSVLECLRLHTCDLIKLLRTHLECHNNGLKKISLFCFIRRLSFFGLSDWKIENKFFLKLFSHKIIATNKILFFKVKSYNDKTFSFNVFFRLVPILFLDQMNLSRIYCYYLSNNIFGKISC